MTIVQTELLTKYYGQTLAVDRLSFDLQPGDLCGFIGPNGSGKTTTIRILAGLVPPTSGTVWIAGEKLWPGGYRARIAPKIGYMPDQFGVYENMRVWEYLEFFGLAYKLSPQQRRQSTEDVLSLTDLNRYRDTFVLSLSRGTQQRLALARVLLHNPELLLLDEPGSGLDPEARIEMRAILSELRRMGKTILISSHILTELATICTKLCVLRSGKLVFGGTTSELQRMVSSGAAYVIAVKGNVARAAQFLKSERGIREITSLDHCLRVHLDTGQEEECYLSDLLHEAGFHITLYQREEVSLEEAYMRLLAREGETKDQRQQTTE